MIRDDHPSFSIVKHLAVINNGIFYCLFRCANIDMMLSVQKQPSGGILRKRCSENMQQIYWRTPMLKCDFNKVAKAHFGMSILL